MTAPKATPNQAANRTVAECRDLCAAGPKAKEAWFAELRRVYGADAAHAANDDRDAGEPGTELRRLYDDFVAAIRRWQTLPQEPRR